MRRTENVRSARNCLIALAVGAVVGCALPVEDKTGCFNSTDCNGTRACIDNECQDGPCRFVCNHIRNAVGECPGFDDPLDPGFFDDCGDVQGYLTGLDDGACQSIWDRIQTEGLDDRCDIPLCAQQCETICARGVACAFITDAQECKAGCMIQRPSCDFTLLSTCADVPSEVLCYEARRLDAC